MNAYAIGINEPRPDNEPYFTPTLCPRCGRTLVPYHRDAQDVFTCTTCGGHYRDWPEEYAQLYGLFRGLR